MNPTWIVIASYVITIILFLWSIKQTNDEGLGVMPKHDDFIAALFVGVVSMFYPGYWLLFMLISIMPIVGCSMAIKKGWWRSVLLVPLFAGFLIFGGTNLPVFWW